LGSKRLPVVFEDSDEVLAGEPQLRGGIDRPLVITKAAVATVVPHQNWRGMFATATTASGAVSGAEVNWPGFETTPWHKAASPKPNWFGSVATGMRDASGQIYMRNRYYNPSTGQFTQPDPIGLAGGLNSYGFAAGDPVSYSDPYGLKPDTLIAVGEEAKQVLGGIALAAGLASQSDDPRIAAAGNALLAGLVALDGAGENVYFQISTDYGRSFTGHRIGGPGVVANVNPNQSTKRHITVRGAHELGHAYGMVINGATDPSNIEHRLQQNRNSLYFENAMRTILGCAPRLLHGTDSDAQNPPCRAQ
jgi:RHS repeat-associated protein